MATTWLWWRTAGMDEEYPKDAATASTDLRDAFGATKHPRPPRRAVAIIPAPAKQAGKRPDVPSQGLVPASRAEARQGRETAGSKDGLDVDSHTRSVTEQAGTGTCRPGVPVGGGYLSAGGAGTTPRGRALRSARRRGATFASATCRRAPAHRHARACDVRPATIVRVLASRMQQLIAGAVSEKTLLAP